MLEKVKRIEEMAKEELEAYKESLLKRYHEKKEELEYAEDDLEESRIEEVLDRYRTGIKACARRIETLEASDEQLA
jgi:polyhydroxyalkanoate synthesis regulator phasin